LSGVFYNQIPSIVLKKKATKQNPKTVDALIWVWKRYIFSPDRGKEGK